MPFFYIFLLLKNFWTIFLHERPKRENLVCDGLSKTVMLKLSGKQAASSHTLSTLLSYMKDTSTYRQDTPRKLVGGQIAFGIGLRLHEGKKNLGGDFETLHCKS